jgi:putative ABC transport system permease protein
VRAPLWATLAAMLILLVIACANVSALMLGQMDARASELAVRMALGADDRRMAQQVLSEALLLGLLAAVLGAGVAVLGFRILAGALPLGALTARSHLDWGVFFAAFVLALLSALLAAWLPLRALRKTGPQRALVASRTDGIGARGGTTESLLVVGQVALAALLLIGAALLVRSVAKLGAISPGLDTDRVAVIDVMMEKTTTPEKRTRAIEDVDRALAALPGVEAAGATLQLPLRGSSQNWGIDIREKPDLPSSTTFVRLVTPDYFRLMGIAPVKGRLFDATDRPDTQRAVVINQALAKKYFPGEDPLGKEIGTGLDGWERVVGVVEDVAEGNLTDPPTPTRYMLYRQVASITPPYTTLVLRAAPGIAPASLLSEARRKINEVAPSIAIEKTTTLQDVLEKAIGPARQVRSVLALLTLFAVLLGMVGVYGVTSHFVRRRQRDLGIRMALGLSPQGLVRQVVGRAARMVLVGIALGTIAALVLVRLLTSLLYGVSAIDPVSLTASGVCLLVIGVLAAALPAWRASRLDPSVLFRAR